MIPARSVDGTGSNYSGASSRATGAATALPAMLASISSSLSNMFENLLFGVADFSSSSIFNDLSDGWDKFSASGYSYTGLGSDGNCGSLLISRE